MKKHFVYILHCADNSYYCGYTTDVDRRLREHNGQLVGGARYTHGRRPVRVVYIEECSSRAAAQSREAFVKKLPRVEKEIMVKSYHN